MELTGVLCRCPVWLRSRSRPEFTTQQGKSQKRRLTQNSASYPTRCPRDKLYMWSLRSLTTICAQFFKQLPSQKLLFRPRCNLINTKESDVETSRRFRTFLFGRFLLTVAYGRKERVISSSHVLPLYASFHGVRADFM